MKVDRKWARRHKDGGSWPWMVQEHKRYSRHVYRNEQVEGSRNWTAACEVAWGFLAKKYPQVSDAVRGGAVLEGVVGDGGAADVAEVSEIRPRRGRKRAEEPVVAVSITDAVLGVGERVTSPSDAGTVEGFYAEMAVSSRGRRASAAESLSWALRNCLLPVSMIGVDDIPDPMAVVFLRILQMSDVSIQLELMRSAGKGVFVERSRELSERMSDAAEATQAEIRALLRVLE